MIVSAQTVCNTTEVQISWHQVRGVVSYEVAVSGNLGYASIRNTTQTLLLAALPCGQDYNVSVQGQGSRCDGLPSRPVFFKSGMILKLILDQDCLQGAYLYLSVSLSSAPCIPGNVTTYVQCESDRGSVSWGSSDGAESYIAVATGHDGHRHVCLTNTTSCTWSDLHCGEEYTVVVRAKDDNCTSLPSNSSVIYMGML